MTTIVFLHAHPDDEASQTSGTMARAVELGHRVVVVFGTNGEHGEVAADLAEGQSVADYRRGEAEASARVLGLARVAWLGYCDSGMTGWEQNNADGAFCTADLDEAARRLADVLDEEDADHLVGYDWHGGYGHPDHVKVHRVVHRAVELAKRRPRLFESTMNRTAMIAMAALGKELGMEGGDFDPEQPMEDGNPFGSDESEISWRVDVSGYLDKKRDSMKAHASQATDIGMFLGMPRPVFDTFFGHEYFIDTADPGNLRDGWPFA